jgi:hypothetical protein
VNTPAKIKAALLAQADLELNGATAPDNALIAFQSYLQELAPWEVAVPFIKELAAEIARRATATRIMRDFARLTSLVKSVAILRHRQRQRDTAGRVIAQVEDYATVFDLVGPMYEAALTGASKEVRATVEAVEVMLDLEMKVTATSLAFRLRLDRSTASRRVNAAIKRGWIVNKETKRGQPWDLKLGEPLPEPEGLPTPEKLRACFGVAHGEASDSEGATPQPTNTINEISNCCTVAGDTDELNPSPSKMGNPEPNELATPEPDVAIDEHDLVQCGNCQYFTASTDSPGGRGYCQLQGMGWDGKMTQFSVDEHPCSSFVLAGSIKNLGAWDEAVSKVVETTMQAMNPDDDLKEMEL